MATQKQIEANRKNAKKGGRKKGYAAIQAEKARETLVKELMKEWLPIVRKAVVGAKAGNAVDRQWLTERGFGKLLDTIALVDPDDVLKTLIIQKAKTK